MKRQMCGGSTPFDQTHKFARWNQIVSKAKIQFNKRFSWAVETGGFTWHCESCHAEFLLSPVTDEAQGEHNVKEIALHKGKQVSSIGTPHYCEACGVTWKIDFSQAKEEHVVTFGSCSSVDGV